MLKYKGIEGNFHYNKEMKKFVGELTHTNFLVTFQARSMKEVNVQFQKAVNFYLSKVNNNG